MSKHHTPLKPEDYIEPRCVLCEEPYGSEPQVRPVPQKRIIEKMNEHMSRRDYAGAERHLLYWLEEAKLGHDLAGELLIRNELVGHYRKTGEKDKAFESAKRALVLLDELGYEGTVTCGTTCVNVATACNAFGENERAMALFERARDAYEKRRETSKELLGGLYNNMALTDVSLGKYEEAFSLFEKALEVMREVPSGAAEQAITYLNMADALQAQKGPEEAENRIYEWLDQACGLLDSPSVERNGYYAFVCEKCAPVFGYYGYFQEEQTLRERAEAIYRAQEEERI